MGVYGMGFRARFIAHIQGNANTNSSTLNRFFLLQDENECITQVNDTIRSRGE